MRNRKLTPLLITLVVGIWGVVAYRVYDSVEAGNYEKAGAVASRSLVKGAAPVEYVYASDVRDPFRFTSVNRGEDSTLRKVKTTWAPPPFKLTGILVAKKGRTAMLEGRDGAVFFLKEGDTLSGVKVLKIKDQVVTYYYTKKKADWLLER